MLKKTILIIAFAITFTLVGFLCESFLNLPVTETAYAQAEDIDSGGFMFSLDPITHEGITGSTKQNWIRQGINYFFERIIGVMAAVIGALSVLVMSYGGLLLLISAGDETRVNAGKSYIKYALIGLSVTLGAYIIVTAVQILIKSIYG